MITFTFDGLRKRLEFIYRPSSNWDPKHSGFTARLELEIGWTVRVIGVQHICTSADGEITRDGCLWGEGHPSFTAW